MNRLFDKFPFFSKYASGKVILSTFMFLYATIMFIIFKTNDRNLCMLAMFLSFWGDYVLDYNSSRGNRSNKLFMVGGIIFIFAHFVYACAYKMKIEAHGFEFFNFGVVLVLIIMLATVAFFLFKKPNAYENKMFWFCIVYLGLTAINYEMVFSYSVSIKSIESLAMVGGLSFMASDLIIGAERVLGVRSKLARELVWWLYPIGQILLITMG